MKILYSIQATGNGHISRAMEILPYLSEYGEIDIFLSGSNSSLQLDAPVKYRSKGLSLYYNCNGGLDYFNIARKCNPLRLRKEIKELPVEKYDLVINDFEYITAAACKKKKKPSVNFGHHASFQSISTPRPEELSRTGELILRNYAPASAYIGLHFKQYANFIFTPIIKSAIRENAGEDKGHITVYLPSYCEHVLLKIFEAIPHLNFEIFSFDTKLAFRHKNMQLHPVNKNKFTESLLSCTGLITGGGFETPAETIHLGKKLLSIPIRSQYEQVCNAAALEELGIKTLASIDKSFPEQVENWMNEAPAIQLDYSKSIENSLTYLFEKLVPNLSYSGRYSKAEYR